MEPYSAMMDILFGQDTDVHFKDGDLNTTTGIDYIEREVYKLLRSVPGDWKIDTSAGASPNEFIGEPNTREVGRAIENHLIEGLQLTVAPGTLEVRVVPSSYSKVTVVITIKFEGKDIYRTPFEFDFVKGFTKLLKSDLAYTENRSNGNYKINDISSLKRPNKYMDRLRNQSFRG